MMSRLLLSLLIVLVVVATTTTIVGADKFPCNFCTGNQRVTKPLAKVTVHQVLGVAPVKYTCQHLDKELKEGVTKNRCNRAQSNKTYRSTCGCKPAPPSMAPVTAAPVPAPAPARV